MTIGEIKGLVTDGNNSRKRGSSYPQSNMLKNNEHPKKQKNIRDFFTSVK